MNTIYWIFVLAMCWGTVFGADHVIMASKLVPDENGVLWFEQGEDHETPLRLSAKLSKKEPYFVVFLSTTDEYEEPAIRHARNLAKWFEEHPDAPDNVPVVAYKSQKATYYLFHTFGIRYRHHELVPDGIMTPQESQKLRKNAALSYKARIFLRERGELDFVLNTNFIDP